MSAKIKHFLCISFICLFCVSAFGAQKSLLPIKKWQTRSGSTVFYVYEPELPIVDIQVVFDAGSARDSTKPGLAKITNEALTSGTATKNADQVASSFDDVGALYSAAVSRDMAVVALRSLADQKFLNQAVAAFTDSLTAPAFPDAEFSRIQRQTLNAITQQDESPASIASKAFYNTLFDDNPYGHPITGTYASVSKLSANDLRDFYKQFYTAQNAMIVIVGDINQAQAEKLAEEMSSRLNQGQSLASLNYKPYYQSVHNKHITFPSSQTHVLIGQEGIKRNDPDYYKLVVGNYILGGGTLTSRLFDEVREKRGLAYTVRSQFSAMKDKGPFIIELQTRNSEANNAVKIVNATLDNFVKQGPTEKELISAKKNLTQGFILRLASNSAIIAQLVNIGFYQLPLDYLDTYTSNISKVTNTEVKGVFQKIIHPDNLITVTVGNNPSSENGQKNIQ